jgi:DNA-binding NtrC family response regulator
MPEEAFDQRALEILVHHNWKGNVRELFNCVQYMAYLGDEILDGNLLPPNFNREATDFHKQENNDADLSRDKFYYDEERELSMLVLECLLNRNIGRKQNCRQIKNPRQNCFRIPNKGDYQKTERKRLYRI